jgi:hypothetical protein
MLTLAIVAQLIFALLFLAFAAGVPMLLIIAFLVRYPAARLFRWLGTRWTQSRRLWVSRLRRFAARWLARHGYGPLPYCPWPLSRHLVRVRKISPRRVHKATWARLEREPILCNKPVMGAWAWRGGDAIGVAWRARGQRFAFTWYVIRDDVRGTVHVVSGGDGWGILWALAELGVDAKMVSDRKPKQPTKLTKEQPRPRQREVVVRRRERNTPKGDRVARSQPVAPVSRKACTTRCEAGERYYKTPTGRSPSGGSRLPFPTLHRVCKMVK